MGSTAFISLGSNLGNRVLNLTSAIQNIRHEVGAILNESPIYESEPWGFKTKHPFLNQVIEIETELGSDDLLGRLLRIENKLGRKRNLKTYESRTIDLDILFYDHLIIKNENLTLPHPRVQDRKFVLIPLNEIRPDLMHPVLQKSIRQLLAECADKLWVKKLSDSHVG